MRTVFIYLFLSGIFVVKVSAQQLLDTPVSHLAADTVKSDNTRLYQDSLAGDSSENGMLPDSIPPLYDTIRKSDSVVTPLPAALPPPEPRHEAARKTFQGKDGFFYAMIGLILALGLLKMTFSKYFNDFQRVFLRRTLKQRQLYEQMIQTPLPSLFLNIFFVIVSGFYVSILLIHYHFPIKENFWIQLLLVSGIISGVYIGKFLGMKLLGWMLNLQTAADEYIFVVFLINKALAIFLLPCLVFILFSDQAIASLALIASYAGIAVLYIYRLYLSFQILHNRVKVSLFHFLIFILVFEVIPLFLIYKLLLLVF